MEEVIQSQQGEPTSRNSTDNISERIELHQVEIPNSQTPSISNTPRVSFSRILLHEHPVVFGDNPSSYFGPPLTLDWEAQAVYEMSVEEYEEERLSRRNKLALLLPSSVRTEMLRESGYTISEMNRLLKPVNQARQRRRATVEGLRAARLHEFLEMIGRGIRNIVTLRRRKREERSLMIRCELCEKQRFAARRHKDSMRTEAGTELAEENTSEDN